MIQMLKILISLEILLVNLLTTHFCLKNKYSNIRTIITLFFSTILIYSGWFLFELQKYPRSMFVIVGFIYFFPIKYLYDEKANRVLTIMFFSWTHTILVNAFAVETAKLFDFQNHYALILTVQSLIYGFTVYMVVMFIKNKFISVLKNIPEKTNKFITSLGAILFFIVAMIRFYFSINAMPHWTMIMIVLISMIVTICYHLLYIIVSKSKSIDSLRQIAYYDDLTGVNNRLSLFLDAEELMKQREPFYIIYMDLDNFKNINDTYGHNIGDKYLKCFTRSTIDAVQNTGSLYRMSGDEFICIYYGNDIDLLLTTFEEKITEDFNINTPFLGVSIGYAKFPDDSVSIDELIKKADMIMYHVKRKKTRTFNNGRLFL